MFLSPFRFGKTWRVWIPLPLWSFGIIGLGEILDFIYGLQPLRGKILSRKGLAAGIGFSRNSAVLFLYR